MTWDGSSTQFQVKYGRVESTSSNAVYHINDWDKKRNEKIRKGYKDVTDLVSVEVTKDVKKPDVLEAVKEAVVNKFLVAMKKYTDNLVSTTYSVKAEAVSQKQVDDAQAILDKLGKASGQAKSNELLIELYTIIPRRMQNVRDHLLPVVKLDDILKQEQDNLDAMAAQVSLIKPKSAKELKAEKKKAVTLLDKLGITMEELKQIPKEVEYLTKQSHGRKIEACFRVDKPAENKVFEDWLAKQKDKTTSILIHGTKCTSVIPILEIGLKIRPAGNFQFSGKAYGDGNYFSEHMQKSLGYTGWDSDKVILVYEVHTGKPFVYDGWFRGNSFGLNYNELSKRGFDSTYVKPGNGLQNSEIIAYKECQNRIKYILWLK